MKYRNLGSTGIEVSEIGFGAWGIGGATGEVADSYGETDDEVSKKALRCAYEDGVTFYDTSNIYGYGHSEKLIGEALGDVRDKIVIASKVGFTKHGGEHDISPEYIRKSLDETLSRLGTDYVDLYQLHSPPIDMVRKSPETMETLRELKTEGKIRAIGYSVQDPHEGVQAIELGFEAIQVNFNMIDQRPLENGLFDLAEKTGVGIITRTPLAFGFLTGKVGDLDFNSADHRSVWPKEQLERWANSPDFFSFINRNEDRTPAQLALKFCLGFPAVATTIPGMLNCEEVHENAAASDLRPLNEDELKSVELVYKENVFFDKTADPRK